MASACVSFPGPEQSRLHIFDSATLPHEGESALRLERADEDEAVARAAFDEDVEHPMDAVVEIDVAGGGLVALDESARARSAEGVGGFVAFDQVSFRFNDESARIFPRQARCR